MPPVKPTPEMEIGQLRSELVSMHRHLRALAGRWDERSRDSGDETAQCARELRDRLDCTPTYFPGDGGKIERSICGAVMVEDWTEAPRG